MKQLKKAPDLLVKNHLTDRHFVNLTLNPTNCFATASAKHCVGQMSVGQTSVGQMPIGQTPIGQTPIGQMPFGQMPVGQILDQIPIL